MIISSLTNMIEFHKNKNEKGLQMESVKRLEIRVAELVDRLPPMPDNIDYLLRSVNEDFQREKELIELVENDPGLCVDLLYLANTLYRNSKKPIETVEEAIEKIGAVPLIQLIGIWYSQNIIRNEFFSLKHLDDYFVHSRNISLGCRVISEIIGVQEHSSEVLTTSGLIHDIGRLIIFLASNQTTSHLLGTPWNKMKSIIHEEREILGMDHCIVGEQICKKWSFSSFMQEGILRHHTPLLEDDFSYLGAIIFLAHFVTNSDFSGEMISKFLPVELCEKLNFNLSDFNEARKEYDLRMSKTS